MIGQPIRVYFGCITRCTKHQIGGDADQAVPPARFAAFDRFEDEITTLGHKQLQRRRYRRFSIGNPTFPNERWRALSYRHG